MSRHNKSKILHSGIAFLPAALVVVCQILCRSLEKAENPVQNRLVYALFHTLRKDHHGLRYVFCLHSKMYA